MSAFTPGPWEYDVECIQQVGKPDIGICEMLNVDVGGPRGFHRGPVTQANARLIAASPELFAACEAIFEWNAREEDHAVDFYARIELYRAAITKVQAAIEKAIGLAP